MRRTALSSFVLASLVTLAGCASPSADRATAAPSAASSAEDASIVYHAPANVLEEDQELSITRALVTHLTFNIDGQPTPIRQACPGYPKPTSVDLWTANGWTPMTATPEGAWVVAGQPVKGDKVRFHLDNTHVPVNSNGALAACTLEIHAYNAEEFPVVYKSTGAIPTLASYGFDTGGDLIPESTRPLAEGGATSKFLALTHARIVAYKDSGAFVGACDGFPSPTSLRATFRDGSPEVAFTKDPLGVFGSRGAALVGTLEVDWSAASSDCTVEIRAASMRLPLFASDEGGIVPGDPGGAGGGSGSSGGIVPGNPGGGAADGPNQPE